MKDIKKVVEQIEQSEKNVDKVLKAARLKRHEKGSMPTEKLEMIFCSVFLCDDSLSIPLPKAFEEWGFTSGSRTAIKPNHRKGNVSI